MGYQEYDERYQMVLSEAPEKRPNTWKAHNVLYIIKPHLPEMHGEVSEPEFMQRAENWHPCLT